MTVNKNRILFIIYTPSHDFLPKRMAEFSMRAKLDGVDQVVITPDTIHTLKGLRSDTVHFIELTPTYDHPNCYKWFERLAEVRHEVELIKTHNNM